jgi:hypothetical protein
MEGKTMNNQFVSRLSSVLVATAFVGASAISARAQAPKDLARYFNSKPLTIIVPTSPGGGYDTFARMVARFVGKHLPGNPRFVVRNIPGGGQLRGLRTTMKSRPDGLTIGLLHPRFVQRELAGVDVPDFNLKTVRVLGTPSAVRRPRIWCARRSIASSWDEIVKLGRPLTSGGDQPGASFGLGPQFVEALGGPIKMVYGYSGTSEIMAGFDRSETEGVDRCVEENVPRLYPNWIQNKFVAPIFWWEKEPSQDWLGQLGTSGKIPNIHDIMKPNDDQKTAFEVANHFLVFSRIFVTPPGVADNVYEAWRKAFEQTTRDPGFLKAAEVAGLDVGLGTAEDFKNSLSQFDKLTPDGRKLFKSLIGQ